MKKKQPLLPQSVLNFSSIVVILFLFTLLLSACPVFAATPAPEGYMDASKMPQAPFDPENATGGASTRRRTHMWGGKACEQCRTFS